MNSRSCPSTMPLDAQIVSEYLQEATRSLGRLLARERRRILAGYQNGWSRKAYELRRRVEHLEKALNSLVD